MYHPKKANVFIVLFLLLLMGLNTKIFALDEDKNQILHLSANTADINQKTHRGEYIGNIEFDQGSTHLRADKAITISDKNNKIIKAIVIGQDNTAHFWTQNKKDEPEIHAYAKKIIYEPSISRIQLIGNAQVIQGNNAFKAPKIILNTQTQHVITTADAHARTEIIIHPKDLPHDPTHR